MYRELIEKMQPKPKLNLKWYKGEDFYSEGAIEDLMIKLIAENEPESYVQAIFENYSWSTYYHLTHLRQNILNWYPFEKNADVLEIGCGLGAITGLLCEKCKSVTAVELSRKRATAALLRCREKENLEIIVGNLNDIKLDKKFDYITLIGVLEYQGSYTETENPYMDFLKTVKTFLKPNGKLLIAIENKYGLKYWCGAKEDHTGIPFEGMNQYAFSGEKIKTFSKKELEELIKESGFLNTFFYYPMPDYKLPTVVYSEKTLPRDGNMQNTQYYYTDDSTLIAREQEIYDDIIKNNVFEFFANSFLVECTDDSKIGEITFASMSSERLPEYRIGTRFVENRRVEKYALNRRAGEGHIRQILENQQALEQRGLKVCDSRINEGRLDMDYVQATLLEEMFSEACLKGKEKAYYVLDALYEEILKSSEATDWENNILYTLQTGMEKNKEKYGLILKTGYLDMILRNAFYKENEIYWFDQEWVLENIPAKYILYRAICEFYNSYPETERILPISELAERYELETAWEDFQKLESLFLGSVLDMQHMKESAQIRGNRVEVCVENIKKIMM